GRVRGGELRAHCERIHGGRDVVVVHPATLEGRHAVGVVLACPTAEPLPDLDLGKGSGDGERTPHAHRLGNRRDQPVERSDADCGQHAALLFRGEPDVAHACCSSTKRAYSSRVRSCWTSSTRPGRMRIILPSPNGDWFTSAGLSASATLTSTTSPETG